MSLHTSPFTVNTTVRASRSAFTATLWPPVAAAPLSGTLMSATLDVKRPSLQRNSTVFVVVDGAKLGAALTGTGKNQHLKAGSRAHRGTDTTSAYLWAC